MKQLSFPQFGAAIARPVNVASVPQRSPFRYPGGKTWLIPRIREWLHSKQSPPSELVEPFAGGGIVSLTAVFEQLVDHAVMVELDDQVASVWETILGGGASWLAQRIAEFEPTRKKVEDLMAETPGSQSAKAFQTIVKNRTFHGGILRAGSAPIKHGENGKGITSRWYPETLQRRIMAIHEIRTKITFIHGDGISAIADRASHADSVFFIDPPYTAAGKKAGHRLYTHSELDHERLFETVGTVQGDFLMTYDDAEGVLLLADRFGYDQELIAMQNKNLVRMTERLIGRDLDWARS